MKTRVANTLKMLKTKGVLVRLASEIQSQMEFVPTGSLLLNEVIGWPGYPCGLLTEIYGKESSGKSLLTLIAEGIVTRNKQYVLHLDLEKNHEHRETNQWRDVFGVDMNYVIQIDADVAEKVMQATLMTIEKMGKELKLIVCDSINALTPDKVMDAEMSSFEVATQSKLLHKWFDKLRVKNRYAAFLAINQVSAKIGGYGASETKGGGFAMRYDPHLSLEVKGTPILNAEADQVGSLGMDLTVIVRKSKLAVPKRVAKLKFYRELNGFDIISELIILGVQKGIIGKNAGWYILDEKRINGQEELRNFLADKVSLLSKLIKQLGYNPKDFNL